MLICNECHGLFHSPKVWTEVHGELETGSVEEWTGCPVCESGNYTQAVLCDCGRYSANGDGVCPQCRQEALRTFQRFLYRTFTPRERRFLCEVYKGQEW